MDDVTSRVLKLFEVQLQREPDVSKETQECLLRGQQDTRFGDDEELLEQLVAAHSGSEE